MGSLAPTNPSLKGHKVVIVTRWEIPEGYIEKLKHTFSDLTVEYVFLKDPFAPNFSRDVLDGATVVCGFNAFPTLEQAPKLEYVQLSSAGINHIINNPLFADKNITFCTSNGIHPPQIAEWVITTFLSFQHHIPRYQAAMANGTWQRSNTLDVEDAVGLRIGILGYGAIGRQVAAIADVIGMEVLAFTHRARLTPESRKETGYRIPGPKGDPEGLIPSAWFHGSTKEAVNNFLGQGLDIVVIALPLTPLTKNLLGREQFQILAKRKTFVSNIGRGEQIVTEDLIEALNSGWIRGAALDVTNPEPLPQGHALWKAPNLLVTPHVSGHTRKYGERVLGILEHNLGRLSRGEALINKANRELGY